MNEDAAEGMVAMKPRPILTDTARFIQFIDSNAVIVDKTRLIRDLLDGPTSTYFLSRPRRFGKTLLLDTIANIFLGNRERFIGMEIDRGAPSYDWRTYPVIRLSFNRFGKDPDKFRDKLLTRLNRVAVEHELDMKTADSVIDIAALVEALSDSALKSSLAGRNARKNTLPKNVVLLIDECDFPLLGNVDSTEKAVQIRDILHEFYSAIKDCDDMLRFTFITGVTKFSQLSIFSGMNNIRDISLDPKFSAICGFTEDEIVSNFTPHIISAIDHLKDTGYFEKDVTKYDFIRMLKSWYDGYTWDGKIRIYNPFSIANCLSQMKFDYYWYDSGTSLVTYKFRQMAEPFTDIFSGNLRIKKLNSVKSLRDMETASFLFQTGYLTIDKIINVGRTSTYALKCPNNEIAWAIAQDFVRMDSPFPGFKGSISGNYADFVDAFEASDEEECARIFSSFLAKSAPTLKTQNEGTYQTLLFYLLSVKDDGPRQEEISGDGRVDLIYEKPGFSVVVEIKFDKPEHPEKIVKLEKEPARGSRLPMFQEPPEHVRISLENGIRLAIGQILSRRYLTSLYKKSRDKSHDVRACAVAIYGWTHCRFRFFDVDLLDGTIQEPVSSRQPEGAKPDTGPPDSDSSPE
ncbi:MAG: AAA family ATPase [Deltaproteobacteria bacterium]|nr:AAA family ATPase [Deltaproteobacteria bacterium]